MCRLILRSAAFFLALVALSAALTPSTVSADHHTFLVFRFNDLQFQGDVDGTMALLTDDAVLSGRGLCPAANPCVGKAAIRPEIARAAADRSQRLTIVNIAVSPNTVVIRQERRSDSLRAAGFERVISNVTFQMKDDKIAVVTNVQDRSDPQTAAFAALPAAPAPAQPPVAGPPLRPPSTGDGGLAYGPSGGRWVGVAIVAAFGAVFAVAATIVRFRRPVFLFIRLS